MFKKILAGAVLSLFMAGCVQISPSVDINGIPVHKRTPEEQAAHDKAEQEKKQQKQLEKQRKDQEKKDREAQQKKQKKDDD